MSARHDFVDWAMKAHGKADTPLGDFAREIAPELPATGSRAELRTRLEYTINDAWVLGCFDVAWKQYEAHVAGELL